MTRKKKTLLIVIAAIAVIVVGLFIFIINYTTTVYEARSADGEIVVMLEYAESDFLRSFDIGTISGGYDYKLTVKKRAGIFYDTIKSKEFYYINDGASLTEDNITVEWNEQTVKVCVDSPRSNKKIFTIGVL